jgi:hypothetical protein
MSDSNKFSISKIYDIFLLFYLLYKFSIKAFKLFGEEAFMVKRNLCRLAILYLLAFSLLTSLWVGFSALGCLALVQWHFTPVGAVSLMLGLNILLFVVVCLLLLFQENHIFFPGTRDLIRNYFTGDAE